MKDRKRKPIRKVSKNQSARLRLYKAVRERFLLEHPLCEACIPISRAVGYPLKHARWADELHHKFGKIGELLFWTPAFIAVCRHCHNWIGDNPSRARNLCLLAPLGQWNNTKLAKK